MAVRSNMNYADLLAEVRDDWWAAQETRRPLEERRVRDYQLFRRFRTDVANYSFEEAIAGPFGWSKLTIPIVFWIVETILPRVAVQPPLPLVRPGTIEAVPYAQAKEIALTDTIERMEMAAEQVYALKEMVLYGDGTTKTTWDALRSQPRFTSVSWFDFLLSAEARRIDQAEVQFHRTWYTRRQLQRLSKMVDRNGAPLFHGLEHLPAGQMPEASDPTWDARREAGGQGPQTWGVMGGLYCLVECWYEDGTVVVIDGEGTQVVQVRRSPYRDEDDLPLRPFVTFSNTPDPEGPYSIGDAETLEDHQVEASTLRNQAVDQTTVNINAPIVYSGNVTPAEIDAAFGQPGGKVKVNGDVRMAIARMPPGAVSADFFNWNQQIKDEAQYVSGVNDNQAGQAAEGEQTATELRIIQQEANKRWQFKILRTEHSFGRVYRLIDLAERRYGVPGRAVRAPNSFQAMPGQRGLISITGQPLADSPPQGGEFLRTSPMMHASGARYRVFVKAGSMSLPSEREEAQRILAFVAAITGADELRVRANWPRIGELVAQAFGFPAEQVLLSDEQIQQQQLQAAMAALPAGPGQAQIGPGAPAEVAVGPPVPV